MWQFDFYPPALQRVMNIKLFQSYILQKIKMLVEINRFDFNTLDDKDLGWRCIEPIIQKIQAKNILISGKRPGIFSYRAS